MSYYLNFEDLCTEHTELSLQTIYLLHWQTIYCIDLWIHKITLLYVAVS